MKKIIAVLLALSTVIAESGVYAATYVNGEDVTNEVFTTISNDYTLIPGALLGRKARLRCKLESERQVYQRKQGRYSQRFL